VSTKQKDRSLVLNIVGAGLALPGSGQDGATVQNQKGAASGAPTRDLPEGWEWKTLGEIGTIVTGNTPSTKNSENFGSAIPFVKPPVLIDKGIRTTPEGLSQKGMKNGRILPAGAVLVSCIGGLGKTGIAKVPVAFNQQINAIVFEEGVLPEYGFYYSQTLKPWLYSVASATTLPIVNKGKFQRAPFPLAPLDQQKLIVAEIEKQFSRLDEAVAGLKRIKANLKRYKAAVLKAAVEGKLTEEWRKNNVRADLRVCPDTNTGQTHRFAPTKYETGADLLKRILAERKKKWEEKNPGKQYKDPVAPDTSNLPELPNGWVWVSLQQVFQTITDGDHQPPPQTESGIPFLVIGNVRTGKIDFSDTRFVSRAYFENIVEDRIPRKGDILYTIVGSYGIPVLIDADNIFCVQRHIAILKPMTLVEKRYLYHILKSNFVFTQATKCATGTAQKTVPLSGLRTISIPFPSAKEQRNILEELESCLSVADEIESAVDSNLTRAERLRQSILKKAFSGGLVI
jgi:type I restriction enzyme, S subunit